MLEYLPDVFIVALTLGTFSALTLLGHLYVNGELFTKSIKKDIGIETDKIVKFKGVETDVTTVVASIEAITKPSINDDILQTSFKSNKQEFESRLLEIDESYTVKDGSTIPLEELNARFLQILDIFYNRVSISDSSLGFQRILSQFYPKMHSTNPFQLSNTVEFNSSYLANFWVVSINYSPIVEYPALLIKPTVPLPDPSLTNVYANTIQNTYSLLERLAELGQGAVAFYEYMNIFI